MLASLLRAVALVASVVVLLSFALFAIDQTRAASQRTTAEVQGLDAARTADPSPAQERARERTHSRARELVDDADDILLAPFTWAAPDTTSTWALRGVPALVALVVYGLGLSFLARFAQGRA